MNGSSTAALTGRPESAVVSRARSSRAAGRASRRARWVASGGRKRAGDSKPPITPDSTSGARRSLRVCAAASAASRSGPDAIARKRTSGTPASARNRSSSAWSASDTGFSEASSRLQSAPRCAYSTVAVSTGTSTNTARALAARSRKRASAAPAAVRSRIGCTRCLQGGRTKRVTSAAAMSPAME